jgi:hypothetical protein
MNDIPQLLLPLSLVTYFVDCYHPMHLLPVMKAAIDGDDSHLFISPSRGMRLILLRQQFSLYACLQVNLCFTGISFTSRSAEIFRADFHYEQCKLETGNSIKLKLEGRRMIGFGSTVKKLLLFEEKAFIYARTCDSITESFSILTNQRLFSLPR